ncbi:uncharacterized protein BDR25DRAFT_96881 [Lindgomyces ingoldianus]|uniref:Uncharacterized protein n=1 Tax=Lindgomyces ingoldianus TaxID=673940 RepID=A0ACB6QBT5_9PLEO|nr:uncharacterized protein BDR25DRAFT_96881 [Lindgomyces ingoldianus]KAF2464371.1 hypothetical protein BDR25DRAFT_96881 [Lindgomyces ingoldianus]
MPFQSKARRRGTSQTLSVGDGLTRKPISDCGVVCCDCRRSVWAPSSLSCCCSAARWAVAAFDERVILCSLLANFVGLSVPRPQRWLYRYQINAEGRAMAYRVRCGHWQMCFDAFVMGFPKTEFSLFVGFHSVLLGFSRDFSAANYARFGGLGEQPTRPGSLLTHSAPLYPAKQDQLSPEACLLFLNHYLNMLAGLSR